MATSEITLGEGYFDDWVKGIGENQAFQFAARASRIDNFRLLFEERNKITGQSLEEANKRITPFYGFLNNLIGNHSLSECVATFTDNIYEREITVINGTELLFDYLLDGQQQIASLLIPTPNKAISMIGHEIVNAYIFNCLKTQASILLTLCNFAYITVLIYTAFASVTTLL